MAATLDALRGLLDKYREIKRLRDEAASGVAVADAAAAMAALSARYPGALRELDQRPMADIEARLAVLEAAIAGQQPVARWMELWVAYHGWLRVALRIKRRQALGAEQIWQELAREYDPAPGEPALAELSPAVVAQVLKPPQRRLSAWAFQRVAERHGLTPDAVERLLFESLQP